MFAEGTISDELAEKIVAFVDREAGRDAPLSADDIMMIRRLINEDAHVASLVEELRATNAGLDTLLDDVAAVDIPDDLVALVQGHGSKDIAVLEPNPTPMEPAFQSDATTPFPDEPQSRIGLGPLATAASIALLLSTGALYYVYNSSSEERLRLQAGLSTANQLSEERGRELADAKAELGRLAGLAAEASGRRVATEGELLSYEERIQDLQVARAALEGRFGALEGENQRLLSLVDSQRDKLAEADASRRQLVAELADAQGAVTMVEESTSAVQERLKTEIKQLSSRLDRREAEVLALKDDLAANEDRARLASATLEATLGERAALETEFAQLASDHERLLGERQTSEQAAAQVERSLDNLEANFATTESRLSSAITALEASEQERRVVTQQLVRLESELTASQDWLTHIAQYHRVYASTMKRHLVEVGADEVPHIQTWLSGMLGRQILVPDLERFGVTFAGARLLAINEKPVAQLVYLDDEGQPLALCITPMAAPAKDLTRSTNGELNLVDWRDGRYGFAVVGWSDTALLKQLTSAITPVYDL